ncbi:hypothetical protein CJ030_MR1G014163 [Morella rubra]|uniref:Uncharacterized protein n=1 Tax=Morella rubra TaxID=262757 RepID=A0A6A1WPF3_9ROSI|nr:hypothetical protein CJ030_MR1G014163 [Morella rubra]
MPSGGNKKSPSCYAGFKPKLLTAELPTGLIKLMGPEEKISAYERLQSESLFGSRRVA